MSTSTLEASDHEAEKVAPDVDTDHHVRVDDEAGFYNNEDGVYAAIPEADYHGEGEVSPAASRRASNSVLGKIVDKSPAHAKAALDDSSEPTRAQNFGTALHCAVLTPGIFETAYDVKGQCAGVTNSGDRCGYDGSYPWLYEEEPKGEGEGTTEVRWYCKTHRPDEEDTGTITREDGTDAEFSLVRADIETLKESRMEKVQTMRERIREHEAASKLLYELPGLEELTVLWTHEATGVQCKSRVDRLIRHPNLGYVAIDLKTAKTAKPGTTPRTFGYDAAKYGYDRQGAFYLEGLAQAGIPVDYFMVLAVEKKAPYSVTPFLVTQQSMEKGREEFLNALREFKQCRMDGEWPHYTDEVVTLDLPAWRYDD